MAACKDRRARSFSRPLSGAAQNDVVDPRIVAGLRPPLGGGEVGRLNCFRPPSAAREVDRFGADVVGARRSPQTLSAAREVESL